jgi:hypothetical protein
MISERYSSCQNDYDSEGVQLGSSLLSIGTVKGRLRRWRYHRHEELSGRCSLVSVTTTRAACCTTATHCGSSSRVDGANSGQLQQQKMLLFVPLVPFCKALGFRARQHNNRRQARTATSPFARAPRRWHRSAGKGVESRLSAGCRSERSTPLAGGGTRTGYSRWKSGLRRSSVPPGSVPPSN